MTGLLFVAVCLAGGLGAALRYVCDTWVTSRTGGRYPLGTTVINLSGSFALGVVVALASRDVLPSPWRLVLGTGLCGGWTTFSTASLEAVRLAADRRLPAALAHGVALPVLAVAAALAGLALAG